MRFVVVNSCPETIYAFAHAFSEVRKHIPKVDFECFEGSLAQFVDSVQEEQDEKTALLSPTNSLCFMGGGFDRAIAELFTGPDQNYREFETAIQRLILSKFNGFMAPQTTNVIDLRSAFSEHTHKFSNLDKITHLVQTPTMAVPEKIDSRTVFMCMWNTLLASNGCLDTLILPALGAGYGGVPTQEVARAIIGAISLFYADIETTMARGAAVLCFLDKDLDAFEIPEDIARLKSGIGPEGGILRPGSEVREAGRTGSEKSRLDMDTNEQNMKSEIDPEIESKEDNEMEEKSKSDQGNYAFGVKIQPGKKRNNNEAKVINNCISPSANARKSLNWKSLMDILDSCGRPRD